MQTIKLKYAKSLKIDFLDSDVEINQRIIKLKRRLVRQGNKKFRPGYTKLG